MSPRRVLMALAGTLTAIQWPPDAGAQSVLPRNGTVVSGQVGIGVPSANALTVTQSSSRAIVNWGSFSVGQPDSVVFVQPDASAAILNRVTGSAPSTIAGQITGNGQVFLVNPTASRSRRAAPSRSAAASSPPPSTSPMRISTQAA
jgi:hypothetical protein